MAILKTVGVTTNPLSGMYNNGKNLRTVHAQFNEAAANITANDIVLLTGAISSDSRLHRVRTPSGVAATAGFTDNDFIVVEKYFDNATGKEAYRKIDGSDDIVSTVSFGSAITSDLDLLAKNATLDRTKVLSEFAGSGYESKEIYIGMQIVSKPTADVKLDLDLVLENTTTN